MSKVASCPEIFHASMETLAWKKPHGRPSHTLIDQFEDDTDITEEHLAGDMEIRPRWTDCVMVVRLKSIL